VTHQCRLPTHLGDIEFHRKISDRRSVIFEGIFESLDTLLGIGLARLSGLNLSTDVVEFTLF